MASPDLLRQAAELYLLALLEGKEPPQITASVVVNVKTGEVVDVLEMQIVERLEPDTPTPGAR